MKILVVGGTGLIGAHAAQYLSEQGCEVTIGARKPPPSSSLLSEFPVVLGDYTKGFAEGSVGAFDVVVFSAGNDVRHLESEDDQASFWLRTQIEGVPKFARQARREGVSKFIQIGSYYHQALPELISSNEYVQARHFADINTRALALSDFHVMTLNPPSIIGALPGIAFSKFDELVAWARGQRPQVPFFAPPGGTNYMSVRSLSEAIWSAIQIGSSGKAYLLGDQNLTFREMFEKIFLLVGNEVELEIVDREHPLLPDSIFPPGRGAVLSYEPDAVEDGHLLYGHNDVDRALAEVIRQLSDNAEALPKRN